MFTGLGKLDDLLGDNFVGEIATLFKSERDAGQFICDANDAFGISIEPLDAKVSLDQGEIEAPPVRTAGLQLFPTGGPRNVRPNNSVSCAGFRRSARVYLFPRSGRPGCFALPLFLERLFAAADELFRLVRSLPAEKLQCLGLQLVSGHKELFQLLLDLWQKPLDVVQFAFAMRVLGNGDDTIVAYALAFRLLERFQHAQELAAHHETGTCRSIVDDDGIERITIFGSRGGNKAPVVGVGQPEYQRLRENERLELGIVIELRPRPPRRFDNHMNELMSGPCGQLGEICHSRR